MKFTSKIMAVVAVMGLALACAPVSLQAQTAPAAAAPATAPAKAPKVKPVEYSGNLTTIDATDLTVTNGTKVLMLTIAPTTKFKVDKKAATLADFAVGDKVTGSYTTDAAGKTTAYSVHKKTLTAAATKTAKKAATTATGAVTPAATPVPAAPAGQ